MRKANSFRVPRQFSPMSLGEQYQYQFWSPTQGCAIAVAAQLKEAGFDVGKLNGPDANSRLWTVQGALNLAEQSGIQRVQNCLKRIEEIQHSERWGCGRHRIQ